MAHTLAITVAIANDLAKAFCSSPLQEDESLHRMRANTKTLDAAAAFMPNVARKATRGMRRIHD